MAGRLGILLAWLPALALARCDVGVLKCTRCSGGGLLEESVCLDCQPGFEIGGSLCVAQTTTTSTERSLYDNTPLVWGVIFGIIALMVIAFVADLYCRRSNEGNLEAETAGDHHWRHQASRKRHGPHLGKSPTAGSVSMSRAHSESKSYVVFGARASELASPGMESNSSVSEPEAADESAHPTVRSVTIKAAGAPQVELAVRPPAARPDPDPRETAGQEEEEAPADEPVEKAPRMKIKAAAPARRGAKPVPQPAARQKSSGFGYTRGGTGRSKKKTRSPRKMPIKRAPPKRSITPVVEKPPRYPPKKRSTGMKRLERQNTDSTNVSSDADTDVGSNASDRLPPHVEPRKFGRDQAFIRTADNKLVATTVLEPVPASEGSLSDDNETDAESAINEPIGDDHFGDLWDAAERPVAPPKRSSSGHSSVRSVDSRASFSEVGSVAATTRRVVQRTIQNEMDGISEEEHSEEEHFPTESDSSFTNSRRGHFRGRKSASHTRERDLLKDLEGLSPSTAEAASFSGAMGEDYSRSRSVAQDLPDLPTSPAT